MSVEVGSIVEGVVSGITNFGAFVKLPGGITGLVHISEIDDSYVRDVKDHLKDNDTVKVKVISIDPKGKIGLSIKQAQPNKPVRRQPPPPSDNRRNDRGGHRHVPTISFEDRLSKFMKESDERQQELRRSTDSKRGGRGASRRSAAR
jgi:S1 RNA binding domain protein